MKPVSHIISWILQLAIIGLLAPAAYAKLSDDAGSIALFSSLGMEPAGRYIIGFLEAVACCLLLVPSAAVHGAILTLGIMIGAVLAHLTKLGFAETFSYFSILLVLLSTVIIYIRRRQIPTIERMLE